MSKKKHIIMLSIREILINKYNQHINVQRFIIKVIEVFKINIQH